MPEALRVSPSSHHLGAIAYPRPPALIDTNNISSSCLPSSFGTSSGPTSWRAAATLSVLAVVGDHRALLHSTSIWAGSLRVRRAMQPAWIAHLAPSPRPSNSRAHRSPTYPPYSRLQHISLDVDVTRSKLGKIRGDDGAYSGEPSQLVTRLQTLTLSSRSTVDYSSARAPNSKSCSSQVSPRQVLASAALQLGAPCKFPARQFQEGGREVSRAYHSSSPSCRCARLCGHLSLQLCTRNRAHTVCRRRCGPRAVPT
ncbi:hypothetical protein EXIGLDRAFT_846611 [Exidia glandulosa HHB12029]|uniref:Uncharacterized protein n=1 Tax=Exidia glandulosa HHB12029 TaxID=1314781 RepID=A0A165Z4W5_EXIGL|nr:hypothetical protein EXIGLDRAFT_846611 [Exidia glandulosa HHB12029]